ncbi:Metallo-dependent hydrolase [Cryphonectria parasitica EP155]|uniref:adenosine deaminase n=1 Tax=Cryphonectria parasitica (strain ATCC 38755 / EP155) TaxID=660469 RepID=A0A9P4XTR1_CRYP1|nr:Metallo-dependent hydrolase [Cryphonectria parasitica EP155]KAF3761077.1 Metallo-dependent hydrolase [Cryphonectria parasitica EP155]
MAMSSEEWEEIAASIPSEEDAFVQKYISGREALIAQEKKQRADHSFRQNLSPIAQRACRIVDRIRDEEQRTLWTPEYEDALAVREGCTMHSGMMFTLAKDLMERTKLWRIVRRMPKGAILHAHLDAIVDLDFVFRTLLDEPGMHMNAPGAEEGGLSTAEARADAVVTFRFFKEERNRDTSIWDAKSYQAGAFVPLGRAAESFPEGGREGWIRWMKTKTTISETDSLEQHHGVDHIWKKFSKCFLIMGTVIHYEPIFRKFLQRLMRQYYDDGVYWGELRFTWPLNYYRLGHEVPETNYSHMFTVIDEELARFKASPEGRGFWGLRMIWTALRIWEQKAIVQNMDHALTTKIEFPHLLAGYDLVGQEDLGRPLRDVLPELFWFRKQLADEGMPDGMPFFFHAGETLGDGTATDQNLFDAVLLGTRRIGHGFSLYKHPLLVDLVKQKRILIESCPISNEVLRLCGSIMSHPLPALIARGVPCSLSNDDPAMLGQDTAGMSHDFWQALQGWENLGLAGLGSLAENSVRWSCFEDQTADEWANGIKEASLGSGIKAQRLQEWRVLWEEFCLWVCEEYGETYGEA